MESTSLSPKKNQDFSEEKTQLDISNDTSQNDYQIKQGMSPNEIADVVSDHLIGVVKQQFETAKRQFRERQ
jgi:hypothetical protein